MQCLEDTMGSLKQSTQASAAKRDLHIRRAILVVEQGKYGSIRKTTEAVGLPYSTLQRRLNGGQSYVSSHITQQLCTPAEENGNRTMDLGIRGVGLSSSYFTCETINQSAE